MKKPPSKLIARTQAAATERNRKRLADLLALVRRRMTEVVDGFYDIGEALLEILDHKLYAAEGHASLGALLRAEGLMSLRQASKLITVVKRAPRELAVSLGHERAYALIVYTDATAEPDSPASLLTSGASIAGSPVAEASVREIKAATKAARLKAAAKRPFAHPDRARLRADRALTRAVRDAMRKAGLGRVAIELSRDGVTVRFSRAQAEKFAPKK